MGKPLSAALRFVSPIELGKQLKETVLALQEQLPDVPENTSELPATWFRRLRWGASSSVRELWRAV